MKTTKLEKLLKKDLIIRCREIEYWNLELVERNRRLALGLGQFEKRLKCAECNDFVFVDLNVYLGGYGSSTSTTANCRDCGQEISYCAGLI